MMFAVLLETSYTESSPRRADVPDKRYDSFALLPGHHLGVDHYQYIDLFLREQPFQGGAEPTDCQLRINSVKNCPDQSLNLAAAADAYVPARQLVARAQQHVDPVHLWRQRQRPDGLGPLPFILSDRRGRGRHDPNAAERGSKHH